MLKGWVPADNTKLPRLREVDAEWRLGVAATGLDRAKKDVRLANGDEVPFDRMLIATGVRSRPWFNPDEAALKACSRSEPLMTRPAFRRPWRPNRDGS